MLTKNEITQLLDELYPIFSSMIEADNFKESDLIELVKLFPCILKVLSNNELIKIQKYGQTILHSAVIKGDLRAVKNLIFLRIDINKTHKNKTALYHAIYLGHYDICKFIIRSRASLAELYYDDTFLDTALKGNKDDIAAMLIAYGISYENNLNLIELKNKDKNRYDEIIAKSKLIQLKYINFSFSDEQYKISLSEEIDIAIQHFRILNSLGMHLLIGDIDKLVKFATKFSNIVNLLIKQEATINDRSLIHMILGLRNIELTATLVSEVLDLDHVYSDGETFLHYLLDLIDENMIAHSIQQGANINIPNKEGITALMKIVEWCDIDGVENLILQSGVDLFGRDYRGQGLVHHAALGSNLEVLKLLVGKYGLDLNAEDNEGRTAQDIANLNENYDMINWINEWKIIEYIREIPGVNDFIINLVINSQALMKFLINMINDLESFILGENEEETSSFILQIETIFEGLMVSGNIPNFMGFPSHYDFFGDGGNGGGGSSSGVYSNYQEDKDDIIQLPFITFNNNTGHNEY